MIYGFGMWDEVYSYLQKELPKGSIQLISDFNKMKRLATKDDLIFFLRFSKGALTLLQDYYDSGLNTYPNPDFSLFIANRHHYLKELNELTRYPLERIYARDIFEHKFTPHLSDKVVMKIGNFHCGEHKHLLKAGQKLPFLKYKLRSEEVLFEEFIPDARSIRIGFVGNANDDKNLFISEHVNSQRAMLNSDTSWIKNLDPIESTYLYDERYHLNIDSIDDLIEESRRITLHYQTDLIGIDWVVSENKTGILELNDMIGIPDDERVVKMFQLCALKICQGYLKNRREWNVN